MEMDGASMAENLDDECSYRRLLCDFAVTNPDLSVATKSGITAFLVPTDTPGFTVQRIIKLFGHIGGDEAELAFDNLYVEPWQVVGEIDNGFAAALYGVSLGRIYNSARAVGYGRWSLELALDYAKTKKRSDRRLLIIKECLFLWQSLLPSSTQHILWASMRQVARSGQASRKGTEHGQNVFR